jgi:hypothetical protein
MYFLYTMIQTYVFPVYRVSSVVWPKWIWVGTIDVYTPQLGQTSYQ